jgi:SNF2 family DNA or RNA helicase
MIEHPNGNREQILNSLGPNDLLITSYGILQSEEKPLSKIVFATIVLDEAHAIKNFTTKTSKAAMLLQSPFRVALTGTPIQNHLGEVWNLFNFINFSQFVTHLSLVRVELDKLGIKYQYLDGSSLMNEREQSVKKFQSGEGDLFLISLKAGGLGLNLTAADYVIHLDPWWNPAIEDQVSDRAHRFGQCRPVTIYRLVVENTIEEKIIELHNTKRDLADSLLEGSDQSAKMSMVELMSLLKEWN